MRVLVTGADGFVGRVVTERLAREHEVRAADVGPVDARPGLDVVRGDLSDWELARRAVEGIEAVVHLAAGGARPGSTPPGIIADSVGTTVALLEAARLAGSRRFVLMSSGAVVTGHPRGTRIGPDTPASFTGVYALGKHLQEEVCRRYAAQGDLAIPILRPWVVVDAERRVLHGGRPLGQDPDPFGHEGVFGWVERRDLADACAAALTAELEGAPVIHLLANPLGRALFDMRSADELLGWQPRWDFATEIPPGTRVPPTPEVRAS